MVSQDPRLTKKVAEWIKEAVPGTPIYIKLTSGVTVLADIVRAVQASGADGLCLIDSVEGILGLDLETLEPLPSVQGYSSHGGYSGRAIKPIALRCVADAARTCDLPIAGVGGIYNWRDALEFLLLGATTVQVCTAVMELGFGIVHEMKDGLARWMQRKGFTDIDELIGLTLPKLVDHDHLPHHIPVRANIDPNRCIGCGRCYISCRDGGHQAIIWNDARLPYVDLEKCVGCGFCPQVCPVAGCINIRNY
jgi:dihydropyrimidine dehydrogenase (NAD+) subunit PreA